MTFLFTAQSSSGELTPDTLRADPRLARLAGAEAMTLTQLADDIQATHHQYLRTAMPRLGGLFETAIGEKKQEHKVLCEIREVFARLWLDLASDMMKEEQFVFPIIRQLDATLAMQQYHGSSIMTPVRAMEPAYNRNVRSLKRLRELTGGFTPPPAADEPQRDLHLGLAELETDMILHLHKEYVLLYPRALEKEHELTLGG